VRAPIRQVVAVTGLAAGLAAAGLAVAFVRPAVVATDEGTRLLLLVRGQSGRISFVNSVTGRPVEIRFRVGTLFHDFAMRTDAATEEYYTSGLYAVNDVVSRDATDALRLCSVAGIHLSLGFHDLDARDGCLEVTLPWTSSSDGPSSSSRSSARSTTSGW
jgi:hypothetical protein